MIYVVSVSGGKDSTALWLWARRTIGTHVRAVFADTGWEASQTYAYLDELERRIAPLERISAGDTFAARTLRKGTFPSRVRKWCSPDLKVAPFAAYVDRLREETGDEVTVLVGIRRDESPARATFIEREKSDAYDAVVWRPLLDWTIADVIAEHQLANVPMNPLYRLGAERVGCWPCIHARKSEIRLISDIDPARIDLVAKLESDIGQTMFALEESRAGKGADEPRRVIPTPIREMVEWSKTSRGGRQLALLHEPSGCARWGICDSPAAWAKGGG